MQHTKEIEELQKANIILILIASLPFPNNEQMVYNTAEDLKAKFKILLVENTFIGTH
jgi:hypothetical protein